MRNAAASNSIPARPLSCHAGARRLGVDDYRVIIGVDPGRRDFFTAAVRFPGQPGRDTQRHLSTTTFRIWAGYQRNADKMQQLLASAGASSHRIRPHSSSSSMPTLALAVTECTRGSAPAPCQGSAVACLTAACGCPQLHPALPCAVLAAHFSLSVACLTAACGCPQLHPALPSVLSWFCTAVLAKCGRMTGDYSCPRLHPALLSAPSWCWTTVCRLQLPNSCMWLPSSASRACPQPPTVLSPHTCMGVQG